MIQLGLATEKAASIPALLDSFRIGSYIGERIMNYQRIYNEFIADRKAKAAAISGYSEKHHILPRALGGGDDQDNLVRLTPEDHVHAHLLLAKIHGGTMWYAIQFILYHAKAAGRATPTRRMIRNAAKAIEAAKLVPCSDEKREKHRVASTGKRHTEAAREKNRLATLEMWSRPGMRDRVAEGNRGQKRSAESRAKMSKSANEKFARAAMGNPDSAMFSQEVRAKLSASIGAYSNTPEGREAKRRASAAACTAEVLARRTATLKASHELRKQYAAAIGHNGKYTEIKLADAKAWALAG